MHTNINDILKQAVIGFEYEFYSNKDRVTVAKELSKLLNKKVQVAEKYHTDIDLGDGEWKLEPDFSGGIKMMELVTDPMGYYEAIATMVKVMHWIKANGWTDDKCALQFSLSFDKFLFDLKNKLEGINRLKFILDFDEEFIYKRFPNRRHSKYARSIRQIRPNNRFVFNDKVNVIHTENYRVPNTKYYGVNFDKLTKGYVEIRYMGGRSYQKKTTEVIEIAKYVVERIYMTLKDPAYNDDNTEQARRILREHKKVVTSFADPVTFQMNYPNVRVFVDLKGDIEVLKTYWVHIRDTLFNLIVECDMKRGMLNYDASVGRYQLKDGIVTKSFDIHDMEIFDSKIGGNINNCHLYRCVVSNAHITDSTLYYGNIINKSKVIDSPIHLGNECMDCYIDNKKLMINGKVTRGIIRSGEISPTANVSRQTEIIDKMFAGGKGDKDGDKGGKIGGKVSPGNIGATHIGIEKLR